MAKFQMLPNIADSEPFTARLGAGTGAANQIDDKEVGKLVKLVGESRYDLCAAGDFIEGQIVAVEAASLDNYSIGSVNSEGRMTVVFDGLQATPGTGAVAVGDYVVAGSATAKGTALGAGPKVCKATIQPTAEVAALTDIRESVLAALWGWRVVSLGSAGTGAVGTTGVVERVNK